MKRKDMEYVVIAAMLLSGLYVVLSGLMNTFFGLHLFILHRYAGCAFAGLILLHLTLKRKQIITYLRRRFSRRSDRNLSP